MFKQSKVPSIKLNSGYEMPLCGLGTFGLTPEEVDNIIPAAVLEQGYRSIDTAWKYGNEEAIGKALKKCFAAGIKREDLFITTKLWVDGKDNVEAALKTSLNNLQLDYVDLYLIHWMGPYVTKHEGDTFIFQKTPNHVCWK